MNACPEDEQPAADDRPLPAGLTISLAGGAVTLTAAPARKVVIRPDEITLTGYAGDELDAAVSAINRHPVVCVSNAGPFTKVHSHVLPEVRPLLDVMPHGTSDDPAETGRVGRG